MPLSLSSILSSCCGLDSGSGWEDSLLWHDDILHDDLGNISLAVVQANSSLEDQSQVLIGPHGVLIGIYDGHGGPEASVFITDHLFPEIEKFAKEEGNMSPDVLKKAFSATEEGFMGHVDRTWRAAPHIATVGSCCLVGAIRQDRLYVANLGDSRAVLGTALPSSRGMTAKRLSAEHNAGVEEVRRELKAKHPDDSEIVVFKHGVWRVKGIIQVSRSIGDVYLKKPNFNRLASQIGFPVPLSKPVLSAEPSIHEYVLHPQDQFLIFASDGLWEYLTDQQAVDIVRYGPRIGIAKKLIGAALKEAAKKRELRYSDLQKIERGIRRHFHDDISVVVIYLGGDSALTDSVNSSTGYLRAPTNVLS